MDTAEPKTVPTMNVNATGNRYLFLSEIKRVHLYNFKCLQFKQKKTKKIITYICCLEVYECKRFCSRSPIISICRFI